MYRAEMKAAALKRSAGSQGGRSGERVRCGKVYPRRHGLLWDGVVNGLGRKRGILRNYVQVS